MRLAVVSDIHGNLEAFKEVLLDIDRAKVDEVACLGDCIGYGPEPDRVVSLVRRKNIPSVMGNHELGLVDRSYLGWFNQPTRRSLLLTQELLSSGTLEFIKNLQSALVFQGCRLVHGFPPESITTYLFDVSQSEFVQAFADMQEETCFVGHTHVPEIVGFDGHKVSRGPLYQGLRSLEDGNKYIINVGSVGQPRDGNNRAKYVIWDSSRQTVDLRYVAYDIAITVKRILELGFPEFHAQRLW
jgi:predicted phosphodiesterase